MSNEIAVPGFIEALLPYVREMGKEAFGGFWIKIDVPANVFVDKEVVQQYFRKAELHMNSRGGMFFSGYFKEDALAITILNNLNKNNERG